MEGLTSKIKSPPKSVMIELTNLCQLACITCPRDKEDAHDYEFGSISFDNFKHVFRQFEPALETLDLTGLGESLMHPQIFEMIRWVRSRKQVHIYLTTNTILLTPTIIEKLHRDPVDTLCISIDGTTQQQFAAIRGNLNFEKLLKRVRSTVDVLKDRTEFIMCVVLVEENLDDMPAFVDLAHNLDIRRLSLKPINLVANSISSVYYKIFQTARFHDLAKKAQSLGKQKGVVVDVFNIGAYSCTFPWEPLYITWDGYIVPCCAKPFPKRKNFGNLFVDSYDELKNKAAFVGFRELILHSDDAPTFCNKCHIMAKTLFREA